MGRERALGAATAQGERTCTYEAPAIYREKEHACCKALYVKKGTVHVMSTCCVLVQERKEETMFIESWDICFILAFSKHLLCARFSVGDMRVNVNNPSCFVVPT